MHKEQERKRTKKWIAGYLALGLVMFIAIFTVHGLFIIPTAIIEYIAFLMFRDIKKLDKNNEDIVQKNIKINQEVKMETTNEEKAELLETLSKDEDVILFVRVTKGQVKHALFEKIRAELETKSEKK